MALARYSSLAGPADADDEAGSGLSHITGDNRLPRMVDVSAKKPTLRTAHARTLVHLPECIASLFNDANRDIATPKVRCVARHPLALADS